MELEEKKSLVEQKSLELTSVITNFIVAEDLNTEDSMSVMMNSYVTMKIRFLTFLSESGASLAKVSKAYTDLSFLLQEAVQRAGEKTTIHAAFDADRLMECVKENYSSPDADVVANTMKDLF